MQKYDKGGRKVMNEEIQKVRRKRLIDIVLGTAVVIFIILLVVLRNTGVIGDYTYVNDVIFPWWPVALAVGALAGVVFVVKAAAEEGIGKRILVFVAIAVIVFMFLGIIFGHINHIFDSGETVKYCVEIEDKYYRYKSKGADVYEFTFTVNGDTFRIDVPSSHYYALDVGDSYVIEYHEGALGEPYYIAVGPVP